MYITPKNNNVSIYCFSSTYFVVFGWHMPAEAKKKKKKKGKWNWTALWEFNIERKQLEKMWTKNILVGCIVRFVHFVFFFVLFKKK
jgi:putative Ca2+/H+ antiporter (TMEM165/GDT1 family)